MCITHLSTKFSLTYLENLQFDLNKIEKTSTKTNQIQTLKKKITTMLKVLNDIKQGAKIHDIKQKEYMENIIGLVKKRDINTSHKRKKITTVPWEIGKALHEQEQELIKTKKRKKKQ